MKSEPPLDDLYPFLHGAKRDPQALAAALRASAEAKGRESAATIAAYFERHSDAVVEAAHAIAEVYRGQGRLFVMGNGGSACDAAHIAVEFLHPVTAGRPALAAINLAGDLAMLSAVANDVGFRNVFVRQILALARTGDGLIGISTSGNSENLLLGFAKAREMGLRTVALVGADGGKILAERAADHCLIVPTNSIHRTQECHVVIYHVLWDLVHSLLADDRGPVAAGQERR
jgi:D-sedoheptulose 7-phosphate isomerase